MSLRNIWGGLATLAGSNESLNQEVVATEGSILLGFIPLIHGQTYLIPCETKPWDALLGCQKKRGITLVLRLAVDIFADVIRHQVS